MDLIVEAHLPEDPFDVSVDLGLRERAVLRDVRDLEDAGAGGAGEEAVGRPLGVAPPIDVDEGDHHQQDEAAEPKRHEARRLAEAVAAVVALT